MSPQRIKILAGGVPAYVNGKTKGGIAWDLYHSIQSAADDAIRAAVREALDAVTAELTAIAAKTSYQDEWRTAVDACLYHVTSIRDELTGAPPK